MGSFCVAGGLSKLPIRGGDKAILLPLIPKNYATNKQETVYLNPCSIMVSNEGASYWLVPRFLPIYGEYDDCGQIADIVRDKNVEYIEEYYGITIEKFIEIVTDTYSKPEEYGIEDEEKVQEINALYVMYELTEVYNAMQGIMDGENVFTDGNLSLPVLEKMGFEMVEEDTEDDRFKYCMKHPDSDEFRMHCDGNFSEFHYVKSKKKAPFIYAPEGLVQYLESQNIEVNFDLDYIKSVDNYEFNIDVAYDSVHNAFDPDKFQEQLSQLEESDNPEELRLKMLKYLNSYKITLETKSPEDMCYALNLWYKFKYIMKDRDFKNEYLKLINFDHALIATNNIYMPVVAGYQEGFDEANKALWKVSNKVLESRNI